MVFMIAVGWREKCKGGNGKRVDEGGETEGKEETGRIVGRGERSR